MWSTLVSIFSYIINHWVEILAAMQALLLAFIGIFVFVPGEQPEKTLQKIVDFIAKFSKKPSE